MSRWSGAYFIAGISSAFMGCTDQSRTITAQSVRLVFAARAGEANISCGARLTDLGLSKKTASLKDFRLFVSDIEAITSDGSSEPVTLESNDWQNNNLGLLDFQDKADNCEGEDKATRNELRGTIGSQASIQGLRFRVGVPDSQNHIDIAKAQGPLSTPSLYWSWQGGYKFMRLDVAPEGGVSRPSDPDFASTVYNFHLGSTNCTGEAELGQAVSCDRSNRPLVELDGFNPERSIIILDFARLVEGLDLGSDVKDTPGCMSEKADTECAEFFQKLGLDLTTGQADSGLQQTVFSIQ